MVDVSGEEDVKLNPLESIFKCDPYVRAKFGKEVQETDFIRSGGSTCEFNGVKNTLVVDLSSKLEEIQKLIGNKYRHIQEHKIQVDVDAESVHNEDIRSPLLVSKEKTPLALKFEVLDAHWGQDILLGFESIPIKKYLSNPLQKYVEEVELQQTDSSDAGRLIFQIQYVPPSSVRMNGSPSRSRRFESIKKIGCLKVKIIRIEDVPDPYQNAEFEAVNGRQQLFKAGMLMLMYLFLGIMFYMIAEKWSFIDSLYFCVVTLTTVGYGDLIPSGTTSILFTCFYILLGISLIAGLFTIAGVKLIEDHQEKLFQNLLLREKGMDRDEIYQSKHETQKRFFISFFWFIGFVALGTFGFFFLEMKSDSPLNVLDAFFLSIVSLTTVGYGNLDPSTPGARLFAVFWILSGTMVTAIFFGDALSTIMAPNNKQLSIRMLKKNLLQEDIRKVKTMDIDHDQELSEFEYLRGILLENDILTEAELKKIMQEYESTAGLVRDVLSKQDSPPNSL